MSYTARSMPDAPAQPDAPESQASLKSRLVRVQHGNPFMRQLLVLRRASVTALSSMGRNLLLTLTTIVVMSAMLGSILLLVAAGALGSHVQQQIAKNITISLEVRALASQSDVDALMVALRQLPHVTKVTYVSPDDALRDFRAKGFPVPDFLGDNPFSARLRVETDALDSRATVMEFIRTSAYKDTVLITEEDRLNSQFQEKFGVLRDIIASSQRFGILLAVLFATIAALVIVVTVRLTVYTRRDELAIMQLVGASRASIVGPFVLESALSGTLAAVLALTTFGPLVQRILPGLERYFEGFSVATFLSDNLLSLLLGLVGVGAGLGVVASVVSTAWYIRKQPLL